LDTNRFHWKSVCSIRERLRKIPTHVVRGGQKSFRWSPLAPSKANRFHWKSIFSIRGRLRKIPTHVALYEGVESHSDGVHWIHWKRIDSTGKVYFLFVKDLEKFPLMLPCTRGRKSFQWSPLDPSETNRFHWKSTIYVT